MSEIARKIATFDFDGTLAKGDSLLPFLLKLLGARKVARSVLRHSWSFSMVQLGKANRDLVKEKFIAHVLSGHPVDEIHFIGRDFAEAVINTRLFPQMQERVSFHKEQGHELILVSATLDVYLTPLAERLGFDNLLCTRLEIENGKATGKLIGVNVRAKEKARQLKELIGDDRFELWAYGNSAGDHEMLAMAQHPYWVTRRGEVLPYVQRSN